jgi:hypothetical protein
MVAVNFCCFGSCLFVIFFVERNVLKERLMNKDDKNRHFVLLIIDMSKHWAKEMGHVKMAGPGFVNDVTATTVQTNMKPARP